jgi:hypothetical protein
MCFFWKIIILALNGRKSPKIVIITPLAFWRCPKKNRLNILKLYHMYIPMYVHTRLNIESHTSNPFPTVGAIAWWQKLMMDLQGGGIGFCFPTALQLWFAIARWLHMSKVDKDNTLVLVWGQPLVAFPSDGFEPMVFGSFGAVVTP